MRCLTKQVSDHHPSFTFLKNVQLKDKPPKYITIRIQSQQAISNFVDELNLCNKLNQSPTADANVNYNMLHEVIKLAKDKHTCLNIFVTETNCAMKLN